MSDIGTRAYASPQSLARLVVVLLALVILADLASIGSLQSRISTVGRLRDGGLVTPGDLTRADHRVNISPGVWLVALILTAIFFIWWFQRIYANVKALGARELRYSHGWSIGAWFVPFLNLVRPARIAGDAWQASDPSLAADGSDWRTGSRGRIVNVWWGVLIVSGLVDRLAAQHGTSTIGALITADRLSIASDALDVAAAVTAMLVVVRLTRRQEQARAVRLATAA